MRRIAFIVAFFGIFVLVSLMWLLPEKSESFSDLVGNERVVIVGEIEDQRVVRGGMIWVIDGIEVFCAGCEKADGRVRVEGYYDGYWGNVQVLRVSILD